MSSSSGHERHVRIGRYDFDTSMILFIVLIFVVVVIIIVFIVCYCCKGKDEPTAGEKMEEMDKMEEEMDKMMMDEGSPPEGGM